MSESTFLLKYVENQSVIATNQSIFVILFCQMTYRNSTGDIALKSLPNAICCF